MVWHGESVTLILLAICKLCSASESLKGLLVLTLLQDQDSWTRCPVGPESSGPLWNEDRPHW